jgi:hypothetical protein
MHNEADSLPIEVIINHPHQSLGYVCLDWHPQPGHYLDLEGQTYTVLERRQRYHLSNGRYDLAKIVIYPTFRTSFCSIKGDRLRGKRL